MAFSKNLHILQSLNSPCIACVTVFASVTFDIILLRGIMASDKLTSLVNQLILFLKKYFEEVFFMLKCCSKQGPQSRSSILDYLILKYGIQAGLTMTVHQLSAYIRA